MSERVYAFLLKLYPDHFRRTYGDEALLLVRDRACAENGFRSGLRLWLDLLLDLAMSLPREYRRPPATPVAAAQTVNGECSFQLLAEPSLKPALLCFGGTLSVLLFWGCVFVAAHSGSFPALIPPGLLFQGLAEPAPVDDPSEAASPGRNSILAAGANSLCVTARRDIPANSVSPLFLFRFAPPGASGAALLDGEVVRRFKNEQRLAIGRHVFAGAHQFVLYLDKPAARTFLSINGYLDSCRVQ